MTRLPLRGASRRDLIKGMFAASCALGLGPGRALDVLFDLGGSALAEEACVPAARALNIVAGGGGFAWFTALWPVPDMIRGFLQNGGGNFAYDDPGRAAAVGDDPDHPLFCRKVDGRPLWDEFGARKRVSALLVSEVTVHSPNPPQTNTLPGGIGMPVQLFAAQAALQAPLPQLVPVISVPAGTVELPYGFAPGGPPRATLAGSGEAMVNMFSSAASQVADRLGDPQRRNAQIFETYLKGLQRLGRTAGRPTYLRAQRDAQLAMSLVAKNLGEQLRPDEARVQKWCGDAIYKQPGRAAKVEELARLLMVSANIFKAGLSAQIILPAFANDDPHGLLGDMPTWTRVSDGLARVMQSFLADLMAADDPLCPGRARIGDNLVLTVCGDLPKNAFSGPNDWADSSPGKANWMYVMSNGLVQPGWSGRVSAGGKQVFNPLTGKAEGNATNAQNTDAALAAVLYATCKGDERRVRDFFTGDYRGVIVPQSG